MNDSDLAAQAFPSMASTAAPAVSTAADNSLREAFPNSASMFPADPPPATAAPEPASTAPVTATATPAPTADAPPAEPVTVALDAAGIDVRLPAGFAPDSEALGAFGEAARDLGLDGAGAQLLVDLHSQAIERVAAEETAAWAAVTSGWREAVKADPEIGGANFDASVTLARGVLDRFAPELKAELRDLGLGNHPGLTKLLARIGRALPGAAPAARSAPAPHTAAAHQASEDTKSRAMFPSMYR
jgi:hypothetical protein